MQFSKRSGVFLAVLHFLDIFFFPFLFGYRRIQYFCPVKNSGKFDTKFAIDHEKISKIYGHVIVIKSFEVRSLAEIVKIEEFLDGELTELRSTSFFVTDDLQLRTDIINRISL